MKRISKIAVSFISLMLCVAMICPSFTVFAQEEEKLYVKDIKIIYADDRTSAKEQLPSGYKLVDGNLNTGSGKSGVYACYSTTNDPEQAITDIRMMHESGGFERTDFHSSLNKAIDGVYALAEEIAVAVNEFAENYRNGVPSAIYAKNVLNYFKYDENTLLGDYMVSGKGTYKEYGQMILMCHEDILNPILSLLTMGVQRKSGENWIDKLADVDPSSYDSSYDVKYRDRAIKLRTPLQQFNDVYCYINGYYDETYTYSDLTEDNDKEFFSKMSENKDMFTLIKSVLQSYPVGVDSSWGEFGATAEDMFTIGLNNPLNLHESYALLECMTPGQEIMLRVAGVYNFLISTQNTEEVLDKAVAYIKQEIPEGDKIPMWEGVNLDIFNSEVGLTNEARRSIAAGKQYDLFTRDVDTLKQHYKNISSVITSAVSIAACSVLVVKCSMPLLTLAFAKLGMTSAAATVSAFAASAMVSSILFAAGITFAVIGLICAVIVIFFLEDIINWLVQEDYERTSIPKYMVDEIITNQGVSTYTYYRRVDNVKTDKQLDLDTEDNESGSDINANEGYRWMALYTTHKSSAGNPIEADMLVNGSPEVKSGYAPVSLFGKSSPANLNGYADENSGTNPSVYMFFKREARETVISEKLYISGIRIETAGHEDAAKKELTDRGYIPLEYDFGSSSDSVIFVGYRLTPFADDAIRDIRVLYDFNGTGVQYGELNYGSMGKIGNFDIMVSTSNKNPAPPVVSLVVFRKGQTPESSLGYEPVNEFSGGDAQTLGRYNYKLYFIPETTYTEGPDYLAGIETDIYYYNKYSQKVGRSWEKLYYSDLDKYGNNYDTYKQFKADNYGEKFFDISVQSMFNRYANKNNWSDSDNVHILSYKYTTTKNPYRALYGIAATKLIGLEEFNDYVSYAGIGHILSPVEISTNSWYYSNTEFPYAVNSNWNDLDFGFSGKADFSKKGGIFIEWETYHCQYDILNMDVTQRFINKNDANAMYVTGYQSDRTPLKAEDVVFSKTLLSDTEIPANFTAVDSMIGSDSRPTNVAPSSSEAKIGQDYTNYGFSTVDVMFKIFPTPVYAYYRNEKIVNGNAEPQISYKEGKYISGVYISSQEEIREGALNTNKELLCENISLSIVENNLLSEGATLTFNTHIGSSPDEDRSANHIYLGISKTNDPNSAIRDIRLYIAKPGEVPKKSYDREITYNGMKFSVPYSLVSNASLTEQGDQSDESCAEERQVYVYVSTHPALGAPITDIKTTSIFDFGDYEPIRTFEGDTFLTAVLKNEAADGAEINIGDDHAVEGNHISFRREDSELPYIADIMIAADNNDVGEAVTKLFEAGYTDVVRQDLNENAGGDYIYVGLKRTSDRNNAVYDIIFTNDQKYPYSQIGDYRLVSSIDLNDGASGKYIYMYAKRKPDKAGQSPLTDICFVGKNPQSISYKDGSVTYYRTVAVNTDGDIQDLNQSCGFWSDYIYLVKDYYVETATTFPASIVGPGSIAVIIIIPVAAIIVGIFAVRKNRTARKKNENNL